MYTDAVQIIMISLLSAILSEGISWVLIYRTEDYQRLKESIDSLTKKVEKKKGTVTKIEKQKVKTKKVGHLDEQLKELNKKMSVAKFKSMFFVALTLFAVFGLLSNMFDGVVVGKLPFVPFPLIQGLTHRNLPGIDYADCSMMFIYVLCSISIRAHVTRFFGFAPQKGQMSLFSPPDSATSPFGSR